MTEPQRGEPGYDELKDFLNSFHFIYPNLNDTFAYVSADSEKIYLDGSEVDPDDPEFTTDQDMLINVWRKFGHYGIIAYTAKIRGTEPIEPVRNDQYHAAMKYLDGWEYEGD